MSSLRIYNAPTIGDLGVRFARRIDRNALSGRSVVQTCLRLKEIANGDGLQPVLNDFIEVCSAEMQDLRTTSVVQPRSLIAEVLNHQRSLVIPENVEGVFTLPDYQTFEFDLMQGDFDKAVKFLDEVNLENFQSEHIPLLRVIHANQVAALILKSGNKINAEKLGEYIRKRESMLKGFGMVVGHRNRKALINDVREVVKLHDFPIRVTYNLYGEDPEVVTEELTGSVIESLRDEVNPVIRIDSTIGDNGVEESIDVRLYSSPSYAL